MEFYELLEKIAEYIPAGYEEIERNFTAFLSVFFAVSAAATCFFGHFVHKIWNVFFFFFIGFLVSYFTVALLLKPSENWIWVLIIICSIIGIICAYYSKYLHKARLFVTTFFLVFASLPSFLSFLGKTVSVTIGFAAAIAVGILSTKYKYIVTIAATAFSGSFILISIIEKPLHMSEPFSSVMAVLLAAAGIAVQCVVEKEELKETYASFKEKWDKIKSKAELKSENKSLE